MQGAEVTNALTNLLERRDPGVGPIERSIQLLPQIWPDRLAPVFHVDGGDFLDLLQGQPEGAQAPDYL
jgi:hypothetical protein